MCLVSEHSDDSGATRPGASDKPANCADLAAEATAPMRVAFASDVDLLQLFNSSAVRPSGYKLRLHYV